MLLFWAVAGVISAAAAGLILFRAARAGSQGEGVDSTALLYRRQLAEIDDLAQRGLIGEGERKSAHAESGRRLLAATDAPAAAWSAGTIGRRWVLGAVMAAPTIAVGLYLVLGSPGLPDMPFAQRLENWRRADLQTLAPAELAAVLHSLEKARPNDPELYRYIALAEGAAQNGPAAVRAMRRAVALAPERAEFWSMLGEVLVFTDGKVSEEAQEAFRESLRLDPKGLSPRYHLAQAQIDAGDVKGGVAAWRALITDLPADDPRRETLAQSIALAERGPDRGPAPAVSGEQMEAIRGMVAGLAAKLKANPDDAEGWVRLVRAYAVLGETGQRDAALKTARGRYGDRPEVLERLNQAAAAEPMR